MTHSTTLIFATALILSSLISGCATVEPLPTISDPGRATETVVIHERAPIAGVGLPYYILFNDKSVLGVRPGEHVSFALPSGKHKIGVRCFGGWSPTWKKTEFEHEFPAQKKVFFLLLPHCASLECLGKDTCADIVPISEAEAAACLAVLPSRGCAPMFQPGKTTANPLLERDTLITLRELDRAEDKQCNQRRLRTREIIVADRERITEHWTLDRCGTLVRYSITYTPNPGGGTRILWTPGEVIGKAR